MKGALHHIEVYCKDLRKSSEFWGWLLIRLGYHEYQKWEQGVSYILNDTYVVLVQVREQFMDMPYHRCGTGLNHLAFHGGSQEFVDDLTKELRARGVRLLYEDRHPHAGGEDSYAVFFEDPNRMKVEITAD